MSTSPSPSHRGPNRIAREPALAVYPDSDKIGVRPGQPRRQGDASASRWQRRLPGRRALAASELPSATVFRFRGGSGSCYRWGQQCCSGRRASASTEDSETTAYSAQCSGLAVDARPCSWSSKGSACGLIPDSPASHAEAEAPVAGSISAVSTMRSLEARSLSSRMRQRRDECSVRPPLVGLLIGRAQGAARGSDGPALCSSFEGVNRKGFPCPM
jgi:hypothetical protein